MNSRHYRLMASIGLFALGFIFLTLVLSNGAVADVDLVISSEDITFEVDDQVDNTPTENDQVNITATVHNQGSDTNATNFYVRFLDNATEIDSVLVNDNVTFGGGSVNVTTSWLATGPGNHTITVELDSTDVISESDEINNSASKTLKVNIAPYVSINADQLTNYTLNNFNFNASGSSDPDGNIVSYFWAFGDNSFGNKLSVTHAYKDDGIYTVTLMITDNNGGTNTTSLNVTILNRAPDAKAKDQKTRTYSSLILDSSNSTDADGSINNVTWYFDHAAEYKYGNKVSYMYTDDGVYEVRMTVKDDDGATDYIDLFITVTNRDPIAKISANRTKINSTDSIRFSGTLSSDKDGSVVNYTWIFPGGINKYGPRVNYTFNVANGSYQVTLVVTDDDGAIGFVNINIKVGNKNPVVNPGLDTIAETYEKITFDGSDSYDPDGNIVNYTWDMGDDSKRYNATFTYFYKDDGVYTIRLTVIDDEGASNSSTLTATILNQAPLADHGKVTIPTYHSYHFNTSDCIDVDGYISSVRWVFQDPVGETTINGNTTYQWNENGTYRVEMYVTDDDGAEDSFVFNVTVVNSNPWAIFTYSPQSGISEGDEITFDATQSIDLDGTIQNWTWWFGDGPQSTGYGEIATHSYSSSGVFTVELLVIDNNGGSNSTRKTIYVAKHNDPPVPDFQVIADEFMTNRTITFDASDSYDPDGTIVKFTWDFGDGSGESYGKTLNHRYRHPGTYNVILKVEDDGGKTNTTMQNVTVTQAPNLDPVAVIEGGDIEVEAGTKIILDGRGSYDDDGYVINYTWDFGDGTYKYAAYVTKTYSTNDIGTKTVQLTVTDNLGSTGTAQTTIKVLSPPKKNVPPIAQFSYSPAEPIITGQEVRFDASSSADNDGTITGYTWLFGDGTFAEGKTVTHSYNNNKVYLVVLTVIDNSGGSGTVSKEIMVNNRAPIPKIEASLDSAMTFESITFDATGSHDDDGTIQSYTWILGDEEVTKTGSRITYAFKKPGNQKIVLKVLDNDEERASTEITMTIENRAPVAKTGGDLTVLEGSPVELDASESYDLDGYIKEYIWDLGDGRTERGMKPTVNYDRPKGQMEKTYTVILKVVDDSDVTSDDHVFNITVMKKPKPPNDDGDGEETLIPGFDAAIVALALGLALAIVKIRSRRQRRD